MKQEFITIPGKYHGPIAPEKVSSWKPAPRAGPPRPVDPRRNHHENGVMRRKKAAEDRETFLSLQEER